MQYGSVVHLYLAGYILTKDMIYLCFIKWFIYIGKYETLIIWGRGTHICVGEQTIIDSGNGLSPGRRQAIIWTNAGILSIGP